MEWLQVLEASPALQYGSAIVLGLIVGSFLNVLILRLPRMIEASFRRECAEFAGTRLEHVEPELSLVRPGSHCPKCGHAIGVLENIPLLSYLWLRGRCSACHQPIGLRYPLVEAMTALLTVIVLWRFGLTWEFIAALVLTWGLLSLAVIDLDTQLLPDALTLPLLWLGLLISIPGWFTDSHSAILGAALGYGSLWLVFQAFRLATGKEGMGFGDFKLVALLGAWLGWALLPQIIIVASAVGAVVGVVLIATGRQERETPIPFGPFLASAGWIALMWGENLNAFYLGALGLTP